jgi:hypothetical protein
MSGITQCMTTSFKVDCLGIVSNAKIALYSVANGALLDATTTAYTTTGEVVGTGYTAGGLALTINPAPTSSGTTAYMGFIDVSWPGATFSADGALIYNSVTGHSIAVLNFGGTKTALNSTFTVTFPAAAAGTAIVQIS